MSFEKIIGQEMAKKKLSFFSEAQHKTSLSPHLLFIAPRGCGKTTIAKIYANSLVDSSGKKRSACEIHCSALTRLKQFVDFVLAPLVVGKEVTLFFDEASEIPRDVTMALLTILNPNKENKNTFSYGDDNFEIDFKKVTFLFATTEPHKIFHALMDRLERIDLEEYTSDNLYTIIKNNVIGTVSDRALQEASKVLRGNARKAVKMAENINRYLAANGKKSFDMKDWKEFSSIMGYLPLGLSQLELTVLKTLAQKSETTLTNLSAKTLMTRQSLQRDLETYLQRHNLIEIVPGGRKLTPQGQQYLIDLGAK